jgi:hypothetical protein
MKIVRLLRTLIAGVTSVILLADTESDLYSGKLGVSGWSQLFLGYRGIDGVLH